MPVIISNGSGYPIGIPLIPAALIPSGRSVIYAAKEVDEVVALLGGAAVVNALGLTVRPLPVVQAPVDDGVCPLPDFIAKPQWDDMRFPGATLRNGATAPPFNAFRGGTYLPQFGAGDEAHVDGQMPHDWVEGTTLHPHVHYSCPDTAVGNFVFGLEITKATPGTGVFPAPTTIETAVTPTPGVAFGHHIVSFPSLDMTGMLLSTMFVVRAYRKTGVASAYVPGIFVLELDFHYQKDTLGSRQLFIK